VSVVGPVLVLAVAGLMLVYNRAVAEYFVTNNSSPFTFLRPQDRIIREDRPERLQDYREAKAFWLPFMRFWIVLVGLMASVFALSALAGAIF
jgi:hypothetical protein